VNRRRRLPSDLGPNRLTRARTAVSPDRLIDLTQSNPTLAGFTYPPGLLEGLAHPRGLVYRPDPRGLPEARKVIAQWYAERGAVAPPERIVLTASTSEAYSLLFKALTDTGDAVLVPVPSYPLFDHLARAEGLQATPLPLIPEAAWAPDDLAIRDAEPQVRAAILVHPNNPTGTTVEGRTRDTILAAAADRDLPLIIDEVFQPFPLTGSGDDLPSFAGAGPGVVVTLGGLSKAVGLPQLKLSWMVVSGADAARVNGLLADLEFLADLMLSVATPTAAALGEILRGGRSIHHQILARCRRNLASLRTAAGTVSGLDLLEPRGGWSAALRYPAVVDEEILCLELLEDHGVAVHPGFFFDFPTPGWLVVSLLTPEDEFDRGVEVLCSTVRAIS
jgi:alanine-synthesizing transaminase